MAIDTPARLAILGAGPIGIEAALYARFLGYDVAIYERGELADCVRQWAHVRMTTPFAMNRTPLGLAAIHAQDETYDPPLDNALLTGQEWIDRYLMPLAQTDLVADHLRLHTTVIAVGKEELLKGDLPGHEDRGDWSFRVLSRSAIHGEQIDPFDGVLDCTGVFSTANWLGHGGIPAIGEVTLRNSIEYRLPDVLGRDRARFAGKHTLLIGSGLSAATNVMALIELAGKEPQTRITWITRREGAASAEGPIDEAANSNVPERARIARQANELLRMELPIIYWPKTVVERIDRQQSNYPFTVHLSGEHAGSIQVDEIIGNVGFRPDSRLYDELQVEACLSSSINPEPNFYILGNKSLGRNPDFLLSMGFDQIRQVFARIGDRESLNLYQSGPLIER